MLPHWTRTWVVILAVFAAFLPQAKAAANWTRLQADDITIYSDASPKDVVEFCIGYVAFRRAYRELLVRGGTPLPTTVLLYRSLYDLQKLLPKPTQKDTQMISFNVEVDGVALLTLAVDGDRRSALMQAYEFDTIWALRRSGVFVPIWMSQGAGEVMSSLTINKSGRFVIGDGPDGMYSLFQSAKLIPWPHFFDISNSSPEYQDGRSGFHAQAWALMHRVLLADEHGKERFAELATRLRTEPALAAVESVLGVSEAQLHGEVQKHVKRANATREFPFDDKALRSQLHPAAAPKLDVHIQQSNLLFATNKAHEGGLELARAQALDPSAALVKEALARVALRDRNPAEAARLYREAIAAGSSNAVAYLQSATRRLDEQSTGGRDTAGGGGFDVQTAIDEIRKALSLNPGSVDGYRLLGRAFFVSAKVASDDITELTRGVGPGLGCDAVRFYRALLHERLGEREQCLADYRQIAGDGNASAQLRADASRRLMEAELNEAHRRIESLAKEGRFDEARTIISKGIAEARGVAAGKYRALEAWLDETQAWNELRAATKKENPDKIRAAAQQFLERFPKSGVAPSVRRMLQEIDTSAAAAN